MGRGEWKRFLLISILIAGVPVTLSAQQEPAPRELTLRESLQIAAQRDIRLVVSQERVAQALARIGQSRAPLLPQLDLNTSQKRQTRNLRSVGINLGGDPLVGPFNSFDARLQLTQTIFDPAAMSRFKAAQAGHELSLAELRQMKEDVMALVAMMYVDARRAAQSVEYAKAVVTTQEKKLSLAQSRLENGIASSLEIQQAQAAYDSARHFWQQTLTLATNTRLDLLASLGLDLEEQVQFPRENRINFALPEGDATVVLDGLPEIQVAQQQLSVDLKKRAAERAEYFPKISALADYGPSGASPSESNNTYAVGVQASMPIFEGGLRQARVREADSQVYASEAVLADTRTQTRAKISKARETFAQAQALLVEKESQLAVARQQLTLIQQRRRDGTATEEELLEAIAQEVEAQDEENEARATVLTAQINWAHVLGKMEEFLKE